MAQFDYGAHIAGLPQAGLGDNQPQSQGGGFTTMEEAQDFITFAMDQGMTREQAAEYVKQRTGGAISPSAGLGEDFTRGVRQGWLGAKSAIGTLVGTTGNQFLDVDSYEAQEAALRMGAEAEEKMQDPDLQARIGGRKEIDNLGDLLSYAATGLGASSVETGLGLAAGALAGPGVGIAALAPMFTGRNIQEQIDQGREINIGKAATVGVMQASLDHTIDRIALGILPSGLPGKMTAGIRNGMLRGAAAAGTHISGAAVIESITETLQESMGMWQANPEFAQIIFNPQTPEQQRQRDEYAERLGESFVGGAVVGGSMGGVGGVRAGYRAGRAAGETEGAQTEGTDAEGTQIEGPQAGLDGAVPVEGMPLQDIPDAVFGETIPDVEIPPTMADGADTSATAGLPDAMFGEEISPAATPSEAEADAIAAQEAVRATESKGREGGAPQAISDLEDHRREARTRAEEANQRLRDATEQGDVPAQRRALRDSNRATNELRELDNRIAELRQDMGLPSSDVRFVPPGMEGIAATPEGQQVTQDAQRIADEAGIVLPAQEEAGLGDTEAVPFAAPAEGEAVTPDQQALDDAYTTDDREAPVPTEPTPVPMSPASEDKKGRGVKWTTPTGETYTGTIDGVREGIRGNEIYDVTLPDGTTQTVDTFNTPFNMLSDKAKTEMDAEAEEEAREAAAEEERQRAAQEREDAKAAEDAAPTETEDTGEGATGDEAPEDTQAAEPVDTKQAVRDAAAEVDTAPTEGQKEAGNYKKGHVVIQGIPVTIENPKGSIRSGVDADGNEWSVKMPADYGYIKRTEGADGDQVDVFIGETPDAETFYIIDQLDPETGAFDEHKVMLGFKTEGKAREIYDAAFSDGMADARMGALTPISVSDFKLWLRDGDNTVPYADLGPEPAAQPEAAPAPERRDGETLIGETLPERSPDAVAVRLEQLQQLDNMTPGEAREYVVLMGDTTGTGVQHEHSIAVTQDGDVIGVATSGDATSTPLPRGITMEDVVHHNHPVKDEFGGRIPGFSMADLLAGTRVLWAHANDNKTSFVYTRRVPNDTRWYDTITALYSTGLGDLETRTIEAKVRNAKRRTGMPSITNADRAQMQMGLETIGPRVLAELGYIDYADNIEVADYIKPAIDELVAANKKRMTNAGFDRPAQRLGPVGGTTELLEARAPSPETQEGSGGSGEGVGTGGGYDAETGGAEGARSAPLDAPDIAAVARQLVADGQFPARGARTMEAMMRDYAAPITGPIAEGSAAEASLQTAIESAAVQMAQEIIEAGQLEGRAPREIYADLVALYDTQPRIRTEAGNKRIGQQFSTPVPMAYLAQVAAGADTDGVSVLEPSAGNGAMLTAVPNPDQITAVEIDPERGAALVNNIGSGMDYRQDNAFNVLADLPRSYNAIVANPPFGLQIVENTDTTFGTTQGGTTNQMDLAMVDQALDKMVDNGKAVLIIGAPTPKTDAKSRRTSYGKGAPQNRQAFFTNLYRNYNVTSHSTASGAMYNKQGANYPVDIIVVEGRAATPNTGIPRPFDSQGVPPVVTDWDALWNTVEEQRNANVDVDAGGTASDLVGQPVGGEATGTDADGILQPTGSEAAADAQDGERPAGADTGVPAEPAGEPAGAGTGGGDTGQSQPAGTGTDDQDAQGAGGTAAEPADMAGGGDGGGSSVDALIDEFFGPDPNAEPDTPSVVGPPKNRADAHAPPASPAVSPKQMSDDAVMDPPDPVEPDQQSVKDAADDMGDFLDSLGKTTRFSIAPKEPQAQSEKMTSNPAYATFADKMSSLIKAYVRQGGEVAQAIKSGNVEQMLRTIMKHLRDVMHYTRERVVKMAPFLRQYEADIKSGRVDPLAGDAAATGANERNLPSGETEFEVDWEPKSKTQFRAGTTVPRPMAEPMIASLQAIEDAVGDIDAYVADKLGYTAAELRGTASQPGPFSQEQVDALAAAIYNHEENDQALIIGDQTGVGKGRIVAGMIRYARMNDMTPIFVTKDLALSSAMIEDLNDIGELENIKPLITQTSDKVNVNLGDKGTYELKSLPKKAYAEAFGKWQRGSETNTPGTIANTGKLPEGYNALFTTYSQMDDMKSEISANNPKPDRPPRTDAVKALAADGKAFVILDESHLASGQTKSEKSGRKGDAGKGRAETFRDIVGNADGVMFSSATYAKNPKTMFLYGMRTAMKDAVGGSLDQLAGTIEAGGIPLQQIVSNILVEAGQYVRRQRTYKGVTMQTKPAQVEGDKISALASVTAKFYETDMPFVDVRQEYAEEMAMEKGLAAMNEDGSIGQMGASGATFSSVMHNIIDQATLAMKIDAVVEETQARIAKGEKVVIGLANTMGAALETYAKENDLGVGADLSDVDFRQSMRRYLDKIRTARVKDPNDPNKTYDFRMTDRWLVENHPELLELWNEANEFLSNTPLDLPFSPIDAIRDRLTEAGISNDEITGRSRIITDGKLSTRSSSQKAKRQIMDDFNGGKTDVLVINQSGSTGISLHADGRFKDQKPRHMVIAQPTPDIVEFMQMLGRIHRTGQKALPGYSIMISDAPAEKRIAARLTNKLRSLNANTSADDKNAIKVDAVDFLNKHGSRVAMELLRDDPSVADAVQVMVPTDSAPDPTDESLINRLLNRSAMMPFEDQLLLVEELENRYLEEIKNLNDVGLNDNEIQTKNLQAAAQEDPIELTPQKDGDTPFSDPSQYEVLSVNRDVKPKPIKQINEEIAENLSLEEGGDVFRAGIDAVRGMQRDMARRIRDILTGGQAEATAAQDALIEANSAKSRAENALKDLIGDRSRAEIAADIRTDKDFAQKMKDARHAFRAATTNAKKAEKDYMTLDRDRKALEEFGNSYDMQIRALRRIGQPVSLTYKRTAGEDGITQPGFVMNIHKPREASNPFALGSYVAEIQTPDVKAPIKVPLTKLKSGQAVVTLADQSTVEEAFERANVSREKRAIVTGNILAGFSHLKNQGQIIKFTRQGSDQQYFGVMMPREFDLEKFYRAQPVQLTTGAHIKSYFAGLPWNASAAAKVVKTPGGSAMLQELDTGAYRLDIHNSMGRRIHMDQAFDALVKKIQPEGLIAPKTKGKAKPTTRYVQASNIDTLLPLVEYIADTHGSPFLVQDVNQKDRAREITDEGKGVKASAAQPVIKRGKRTPLATGVMRVVDAMTGGQADVETVERLVAGGESIRRSGALTTEQQEVSGMYDPLKSLITVSMNSPFGADVTAVHEAWHWMRDKGIVPESDLKILERANKRLRKLAEREIGKESAALLDQEEAEAYAIQRYYSDPKNAAFKGLEGVMERVRQFFERFANWMAGSGFRDIDDVMGDALSGRMAAARTLHPANDWKGQSLQSADPLFSAAQPVTHEQFSEETNSAFEQLKSQGLIYRQDPAARSYYGRFKSLIERIKEDGFAAVANEYIPSMATVRQKAVDRFEALRQLDLNVAGSTGDIANGLQSVWKRAHLVSVNTGPMMERMLKYGNIVWDPERKDFHVDQSGGFMDITKPIGQAGLMEHFEFWLAAERMRKNPMEKKRRDRYQAAIAKGVAPEKLPSKPLMDAAEFELAQTMYQELTGEQRAMFDKARSGLISYNRKFIEQLGKSGLLGTTERGKEGKSEVDRLLGSIEDDLLYIPLNRLLDPDNVSHTGDGVLSVKSGRGFSTSSSGMHALKGSSLALQDPMETLMRNMHSLLDRARRNAVSADAIRIASNLDPALITPARNTYKGMMDKKWLEQNDEQLIDLIGRDAYNRILEGDPTMRDVLSQLMGEAPQAANQVSVMIDGKPKAFNVNDANLLESLRAMEPEQRSWFEKNILGGARRVLTRAVSADPTFMYRNVLRDAQQAWVLAPNDFKPVVSTAKGFQKVWKGALGDISEKGLVGLMSHSPDLLDIGAASLYDNATIDRLIHKTAGKEPRKTVLGDGVSLWQLWEEVGRRAELANRQAVYDAVLEATGNTDEALFQATFMTNYASRGSSKALRWIIATVPYINARIQGLDRLILQAAGGKADKGTERRRLAGLMLKRGLVMGVMSMTAAFLLKDDERYEQLEEWEKDAYFHFGVKGGDGPLIRIPKGFEVGLLFGTFPERAMRFATGTDSGKEAVGAIQRGFMDTLSFDPTPQLIKPWLEVARNRNSFTGRPIETMGMRNLPPHMRYHSGTSEALKDLYNVYNLPNHITNFLFGTNNAISPVQMESMIRGYTGPMGAYGLAIADGVTEAMTGDASPLAPITNPTKKIMEGFKRSSMTSEVPRNTEFTTEFYDLKARVDQAYSGYRRAEKLGDVRLAQKIIDENMRLLQYRGAIRDAQSRMSEARAMIKRLQRNKPAGYEQQIDKLQTIINQISQGIVQAVAAE